MIIEFLEILLISLILLDPSSLSLVNVHWNATCAAISVGQAHDFHEFLATFLFSLCSLWIAVESADHIVSQAHFLFVGVLVKFLDHLVEDEDTMLLADWDHAHVVHILVLGDWVEVGGALSHLQQVVGDLVAILEHRDDLLWLVGWSEANVTVTEDVLVDFYVSDTIVDEGMFV